MNLGESQDSSMGSRAGSRASDKSQSSRRKQEVASQQRAMEEEKVEDKLEGQEVVQGLCTSLAVVRPPTIAEWNLHKNVIGDKKLLPIYVPF